MTTKLAFLLFLSACVDLESEAFDEVEQESHSTSAAGLPNRIVLAKLETATTTASTSMLQFTGNRLFANRADAHGTPILHHYFPAAIIQLVVGDFSQPNAREHDRDQVCARLLDNTLWCYAPSDDTTELRLLFKQTWPLALAEVPIVGDFTGDGADDILAFDSMTGSLRLFDRTTGPFTLKKSFSLGNLASHDLRGKKLYAGEFGQAANRTDLLVVDPATGAVSRFDSATESSTGRTTFWWAFTTSANTLASSEQITIANLEGGDRDGLLLRDASTGTLRARRVEYAAGYLASISSSTLSLGQLPVTTNAGTLAAVRLVDHSAEPNGAKRDDVLFFDRTNHKIIETSARHDGTRMTYWWGWTKATPVLSSWTAPASKMALVFCKAKDVAYEPDKAELTRRILGVGNGSVRDWLLEVSYGSLDIKDADVTGWVTSSHDVADSTARKGTIGTGAFINDCMTKAGITAEMSEEYDGRVLVISNEHNSWLQGYLNGGAVVEYDNILDPNQNYISVVAHELMHAFGLGHAHDDSGRSCKGDYCDFTSTMGDQYQHGFPGASGWVIGPGLNAMNLDLLGVVPSSRIVEVAHPTSPQSRTITLAALERPEANGALYVKVRTSSTKVLTIALRHSIGYDREVPSGVQIHELELDQELNPNRRTILHVHPKSALQPGDVGYAGGYLVTVNSFDAVKQTATITLAHY